MTPKARFGEESRSHELIASARSSHIAIRVTCAAITLAFAVMWASAIRRPFVDDDWGYLNVVQRPGWWHSPAIWNPSGGLYRPGLYIWFGLIHSLVGVHPLGYHIATAAVAFIVGVLTWRIAIALGLGWGALIAGAAVLFSPVVGYSISWTSAASSPLSVAFALGSMLILLNRPATIPRSIVAGLLLLVGLLTREVVIVAPGVLLAVAWARPGATFKNSLRLSFPLWVVSIGYILFRSAAGARNPTGPYHMGLSSHVIDNASSLILRTVDLPLGTLHAQDLRSVALFLVVGGLLYWSLVRRSRLALAGLVWFGLGLLPVLFLVNHPPDPYYIDFALPGLAIAIGAAYEQVAAIIPGRAALALGLLLVIAIGLEGWAFSESQFIHELGPDAVSTQRLLTQAAAAYPKRPSGEDLIVLKSATVKRIEEVSCRGDLFRVEYRDPFLRVRFTS